MAVNFPSIHAEQLHPVAGVELGFAQAGIRKADKKDVLVIRLAEGTSVSGVFTTNAFCAAPVPAPLERRAAPHALAGAGGAGGFCR